MTEIVKVHFPSVEDRLLEAAIAVFEEIRSLRSIRKKPGTSELIDWVNALSLGGIPPEKVAEAFPYPGILLKKEEDMEAVKKHRYL